MVNKTTVRIYQVGPRHTMNLPSEFVRDSAFPFTPKEDLIARIEGRKIVIEKANESLDSMAGTTRSQPKPET